MRKIIDFLIKNIHSLTFSLLLLLSLTQIINKNYYHNRKFQLCMHVDMICIRKFNFFSNSFVNLINEEKQSIVEYFELKKINEKLVSENNLLRNNYSKNKKIDSVKSVNNYLFTSAKIISNNIKFSKNFITINKGENDNIEIDDGVISNNGVIGIINNTSEKFSTLISILNTDLIINARIKSTNHFGSLSWDANDYELLNLLDIPKSAKIKINDTIETGGMSSIFPKNIPIGTIQSFNLPTGLNYYEITVKLFEDIGSIQNVYVVKNNFKDEIKKLENNNEQY